MAPLPRPATGQLTSGYDHLDYIPLTTQEYIGTHYYKATTITW